MIPIVIPAMMICLIIGLVLSVVSRFAFHWLGGEFSNWGDIFSNLGDLEGLAEQF